MNTSTSNDLEPTQSITANLSRRRFLVGSAGVAGAAVLLAACGDNEDPTTPTAGDDSGEGAGGTGDLDIARAAVGLEVLAVNTYQAALDAATAGSLGDVPPAVATYVTTALAHHKDHRDTWNDRLTAAGEDPVTEPNAQLKPTVDAEFAKVTDVAGVARLALMLEDIAAQTYLKAVPLLGEDDAIKLAGSIQIVDQQHQSILLFVLGEYPVPEVFQKTEKAVF